MARQILLGTSLILAAAFAGFAAETRPADSQPATAPAAQTKPAAAIDQLQGTWVWQEATEDGEAAPADSIKKISFTFAGDKVTAKPFDESGSGEEPEEEAEAGGKEEGLPF